MPEAKINADTAADGGEEEVLPPEPTTKSIIIGEVVGSFLLSFLGLGILPPTADWGQMVNAGRGFFPDRWWYSAAPGLAIFIVALAFSVLGDTLRDRNGEQSRADA